MELPGGRRSLYCRPFMDSDLTEMLNNKLVKDLVSWTEADQVSAATSTIYKAKSTQSYSIHDVDKKSFLLQEEHNQKYLLALHLKHFNYKPEKLNVHFYISLDNSRQPVALELLDRNLYLSCIKEGNQCQLKLEKPEKSLQQISGKDLQKFLFYFKTTGTTTSFESLAHRGWYVATSKRSSESVTVHNHLGQQFYTDFELFTEYL
uniref:Interleukin-1 n=1 Tax=Salvator merianae TaxID=96440 RepID=A0A8D0BXC3_SALMN